MIDLIRDKFVGKGPYSDDDESGIQLLDAEEFE